MKSGCNPRMGRSAAAVVHAWRETRGLQQREGERERWRERERERWREREREGDGGRQRGRGVWGDV